MIYPISVNLRITKCPITEVEAGWGVHIAVMSLCLLGPLSKANVTLFTNKSAHWLNNGDQSWFIPSVIATGFMAPMSFIGTCKTIFWRPPSPDKYEFFLQKIDFYFVRIIEVKKLHVFDLLVFWSVTFTYACAVSALQRHKVRHAILIRSIYILLKVFYRLI